MDHEHKRQQLRRALAGDGAALDHLVETLTPIIQARVARGLKLWLVGSAAGRSVRQEVEDLAQEVFVVLFAEDGKVLRRWQPELGLSLENYVGLVAERQTASVMRSGRRSPWKEDPTFSEELDGEVPESDPEEAAASREELRLLVQGLYEILSPLGRRLFDLLYLRQLSVADVAATTGMNTDAVYAWRSRLRRQALDLRRKLSNKTSR